MTSPGTDLRKAITFAVPRLRILTVAQASTPRAQGKWSPKQIIGHLIDSASNNHGRFVRAQLTKDMRFQGYAQDDWVHVQRYADADWSDLLELWERFNLHIAWVMDHTPEEVRLREYSVHGFDEVAFRTRPAGQPATLDWFMRDYVEHLKHHLQQIDAELIDR